MGVATSVGAGGNGVLESGRQAAGLVSGGPGGNVHGLGRALAWRSRGVSVFPWDRHGRSRARCVRRRGCWDRAGDLDVVHEGIRKVDRSRQLGRGGRAGEREAGEGLGTGLLYRPAHFPRMNRAEIAWIGREVGEIGA